MADWLAPIAQSLQGQYKQDLALNPAYTGGIGLSQMEAPVIGNNFWSAFLPQVALGGASGLAKGYGRHQVDEEQKLRAGALAQYATLKTPEERAQFLGGNEYLKDYAPQLQIAEMQRTEDASQRETDINDYLAKQGIDPATGQAAPWVSNLTAAQAGGRASAAGPRTYTSYENGQRVTKQAKFNAETGQWEDSVIGSSPQVPDRPLNEADMKFIRGATDTIKTLTPLIATTKKFEAEQRDTGPILTAIQAKIMESVPGADWNLYKTVMKAEGKKAAVAVFGSGTGLSEKEGDIIMDLMYDPGAIGAGQLSPRLETLVKQAYSRATGAMTPRIAEKKAYSNAAKEVLTDLYSNAPNHIQQELFPQIQQYGLEGVVEPKGYQAQGTGGQYNQPAPAPVITEADKAAHPGQKFQWSPSRQQGRWVPL